MSKEKILNGIGFALIAIGFLFALERSVERWIRETDESGGEKKIVLRLAHWQLEGGVREALDAIARRYSERNPGVEVVQVSIPERIYPNWLITQLVGGSPPDIIEIGGPLTSERLARYFVPLTDLAAEPNPYNKGTPLEGEPMRETFFDGMEGGFEGNLLEYYGVPISSSTIRIFYNLPLLKKITGEEKLPKTFEEFQSLCEKTVEYSRRSGEVVFPLAGSKSTGQRLLGALFGSQTQKLLQEQINPPGVVSSAPGKPAIAAAYQRGDWSLESPAVLSGLRLMRDFGKYMQTGFMQLGRDDATFYFAQGRALMMCTGSWDATTLRKACPFRIGASFVPLPGAETPGYGKFSYGKVSEANQNAGVLFGVTKASPHRAQAEDFLRFLASVEANKIWTDISLWPPAVVGVEPAGDAKIFAPVVDGFMSGFALDTVGADTSRLVGTNINALFAPEGGPEAFAAAIRGQYGDAMTSDMRRFQRTTQDNLRRADTVIGVLGLAAEPGSSDERKLEALLQSTIGNETIYYQNGAALCPEAKTR